MRRVLIGTPTYTGDVAAQYLFSYSETLRLCIAHQIDLRVLLPVYDSVIQHARNKLVASAIQYNFDDLVFIDADQDWRPEDFMRLLSHPVHCVGAPVRKKNDERELYNVRTAHGPRGITTDAATGLMTAPDMALGTGMLRLSKLALQTLWAAAEPYKVWGDADEYRWIFDIRPQQGELTSEDNIMVDKLRSAGIPTWLDQTIVAGHYGMKRYAGDFKAWLEAQKDAA